MVDEIAKCVKSKRAPDIAAPAEDNASGPKEWLMDTGSGHDLIGRSDLSSGALARRQPAECPITLNTANGLYHADEEIPMLVHALDEGIRPLLMESTPAVISIGRRCKLQGYSFWWLLTGIQSCINPLVKLLNWLLAVAAHT